jgi:hypothetical protein
MSLNVGVASMYPVAEATSAAYLLDSAQIFGVIFILMMGAMIGNLHDHLLLSSNLGCSSFAVTPRLIVIFAQYFAIM